MDWETFVLDRVLFSSVVFPVEYGFIPQTWFDDNDPLDIMVLSHEPLEVGCIVKVRTIGALIMEDEEGDDPKILSVPTSDPRFNGYNDLHDVHPHKLKEIQEFFEVYKRLEPKKWVKFKEWRNAEQAREIISHAINLYCQKKK
ncbi:MAG: inorganic diphosphatase [Candidatus Bathyarchaeia archaeon]